ncbi:unnamed protein product [Clonostachys chloroleuca]|uniref:anthranilate synthase n=1 Tax=Clonostachys chloroleuca TaxID=1926264 RepID=A0AA35QAI6_9HYPO|nr:unnamed protein product [Clonostachys chloroleuca]
MPSSLHCSLSPVLPRCLCKPRPADFYTLLYRRASPRTRSLHTTIRAPHQRTLSTFAPIYCRAQVAPQQPAFHQIRSMASDSDYMSFLDKANEDVSGGGKATTQSKGHFQFKATDTGAKVPKEIKDAIKDTFMVSEADEPFEAVSLEVKEDSLPDEVQFAELINHWDPNSADIEILDPLDWDKKGRYTKVIEAVRQATEGNDRDIVPSLDTVRQVLTTARSSSSKRQPNLVPVYRQISSDLITPSAAYLKVSAASKDDNYSFLFESAATEQLGRYSFVGAGPRKILTTGPGYGEETDPLRGLEKELAEYVVAQVPGLKLPPMAGGAVGYVGYDCVRYFEPKTARPMKDVLKVPESLFMLYDSIVAFDRFYGIIKVISYVQVPEDQDDKGLEEAYAEAGRTIDRLVDVLESPEVVLPKQEPIQLGQEYTSNIGRDGYEAHVTKLKEHIVAGDIIQAVPSQRFARPTNLHPFNIYRHLRTVNPSPYLFYVDCKDFQLVGASPELLVKSEEGRIITHPIAGTVKRGATPEDDQRLADELRSSLKDRAEHVMLVDLARNDVNRVADPLTVRVDRLMVVEKFSHVQHLVSQVSGVLRPGQTRFDAFRSIFPAGTVSGAPKVKAMELIAELEGEKRGIYAGAVGYFGYDGVDEKGAEVEGAMDTCIALRTMLTKDGVAYLQAGGGIVFDSDEYEEWMETINKLGANMHCITSAEQLYHAQQQRSA